MTPIFQSKNIYFIKVTELLINDYLEMVNDIENVAKYIGGRREPLSAKEELDYINSRLKNNSPMFSMLEKQSGKLIGNIEIMDINNGCGELGIAITSKMQGKGYGSEALKRITEYAFESLGLTKIYLKVYPWNKKAIHVYKKCGFRQYNSDENNIYMEITS